MPREGFLTLTPDSDLLFALSLEKRPPASQDEKPQRRIADSSSKTAVSFSSPCRTKRFPSSRCVSATKIVRPRELTAYAEPNAISNAIDYAKSFSRSHRAVIRVYDEAGNVIETREHKGDFKVW